LKVKDTNLGFSEEQPIAMLESGIRFLFKQFNDQIRQPALRTEYDEAR